MKFGIIGLGKMGEAIAWRVHRSGFSVIGYDVNPESRAHAQKEHIHVVDTVEELIFQSDLIWIMVPAGNPTEQVIDTICKHAKKETIVIDGGNSQFQDSVARGQKLQHHGLSFLDCGTSGGVHGKEHGFCLMVGGEKNIYDKTVPILKAIATEDGVSYVGPSGAGHYVKMIHNGIEYGLLEAYAEGFHLLAKGTYPDLDLEKIAHLWQHGAVIRSFLLDLTREIYKKNPNFSDIDGIIEEGGTGQWTAENAQENKIPMPVLHAALDVRAWSRKTGGNYTTKLIALLRNAFGGHAVRIKK